MLIKLNHKERGGKLYFKITIDFVDCSKLLESLVSETKHVILFVKISKQYSWRIFGLVWSNFLVLSALEVVASGNVCSLVERCTALNERLKVHI